MKLFEFNQQRQQNEKFKVYGYGNNWKVVDSLSDQIVKRFVDEKDAWKFADKLEAKDVDKQRELLRSKSEQEETRAPDIPEPSLMRDVPRVEQDVEDEPEEELSFLQRLGYEDDDEEDVNDVEVRQQPQDVSNVPVSIENLPDRVNKAMSNHTPIEPEWFQIRNLPGYLRAAIHSLGRQKVSAFTDASVEDIMVIASLGTNEPNSQAELNAVTSWLRDEGEQDIESEDIYTAEGYTFLIAKDDYGEYVYAWPTTDDKY
jgi:hypothetical protein